ncbi:hypothetical protein PRO82_001959 [Candidatus Protochlamydia amoebophila]|nr:hypothetical protein [Candidatus Protochlamydia amoebophila]
MKYAITTRLSALLDKQISHDKITRFLNDHQFNSKDWWQYIKPKIR